MIDKLEAVLYDGADRTGYGTFVRDPNWVQLTTPEAPIEYRNVVLRSVLEPAEVDGRIAAVEAHYDALGVPFRWFVTPSTRPRDFAETLRARGYVVHTVLECLAANPADFSCEPAAPIEVVAVGPELQDEWIECAMDGWRFQDRMRRRMNDELTRDLASGEARYFLARFDGEPAGTGSLLLCHGFGHLNGSCVAARFRRKGIYRQLVLARMAFLAQRGITLVTNHCVRDTSAPICKRLGFRHEVDFTAYCRPRPT